MDAERGVLRRLQVLEAAIEVIADRGLAETRITDIATKAGLSTGLLLYYFGSKDELLMEALTHAEDRFYLHVFQELAALQDAPEKLAYLIDRSVPEEGDTGEPNLMWKLWPEMWVRAMRIDKARERRMTLDRRWRQMIADVVREGQGNDFDLSPDPDDFAVQLAALIDGLAVQVVLRDPFVTAAKMRQVCTDMVAHQLDFKLAVAGSPTTDRDANEEGPGARRQDQADMEERSEKHDSRNAEART